MKLQPFQFFSPRKPRRSFHLESDDKPAGENRLKSANSGVYLPAAALSDWCRPQARGFCGKLSYPYICYCKAIAVAVAVSGNRNHTFPVTFGCFYCNIKRTGFNTTGHEGNPGYKICAHTICNITTIPICFLMKTFM